MLRLLTITFAGLWAAFMVFGRDLSAEEKAEWDMHRSGRVSMIATLSDTFDDAFGSGRKRQGAYVPTLAQIKAQNELVPSRVQPEVRNAVNQNAMVQLASYSDAQPALSANSTVKTVTTPAVATPAVASATTRVTDPEKLMALLHPTQGAASEVVLGEVTASRVNVRSGPSTSNEVLGQVHRSDIVQVLSPIENGWVKISIEGDGVSGYMSAEYLTGLSQ